MDHNLDWKIHRMVVLVRMVSTKAVGLAAIAAIDLHLAMSAPSSKVGCLHHLPSPSKMVPAPN